MDDSRSHLARLRSPFGLGAVRVDEQGDLAGERHHAPDLVADGAELRLEGDRVEPGRRAASGCLRSWLQKNAASDRRGRTTRSLPARTLSGSRLSMLADGDEVRQ